MILTTSAIGYIALDLLSKNHTFTVHSIFNKGFNIINNDQQIIFIGTDENGKFPFGILVTQQVKEQLLNKIAQNEQVIYRNKQLQFQDVQLMINDNVMPYEKTFETNTDLLKDALNTIDFSEYESSYFPKKKLKEFIYLLGNNEASIEEISQYFIGRGQGLTPTGDDIIVGILFVHFIRPFIREKHIQTLSLMFNQKLTTTISENFIQLAAQGVFSSRITDLLKPDTTYIAAIKALISVGSSSGKDTAYGIYSAFNLCQEEK